MHLSPATDAAVVRASVGWKGRRAIRSVCLAASLALLPRAACAAGGPPADDPRTETATLQVPPGNLLFSADGPDEFGGFSLMVKTAGLPVRASRCTGQPGLLVQMGDTTPTGSALELDAAQKARAAAKVAYFKALKAARDSGRTVTLNLEGSPTYLVKQAGTIVAPYCALNLAEKEPAP